MNRRILGLDISTTCTGCSILDYNDETNEKKIVYIGSVKFKTPRKISSEDSLFYKSKQFTEDFINKYKDLKIDEILIEAPLPNSNNLLTIHTLARFNGMLSQAIYSETGIAPHYISSYDARKFGFPSLMSVRRFSKSDEPYPIDKIRKEIEKNELVPFGGYTYSTDKKYILWQLINEQYDGIQWQYNKKGELKKENFDASDSLVTVLGWINYIKYYNTEPKIISSSESKIKDDEGNEFTKIEYTVEFCDEQHKKYIII